VYTGGTAVTICGQDFQSGATVRIDGVTQASIEIVSSDKLTFVSVGGVVGGPYLLEVENPDLGLATSVFHYEALPDPSIELVDPGAGTTAGGDTILIAGENFTSDIEVYFGVDPDTGDGGELASVVTVRDPSTLEVVTPPHARGLVGVMVVRPSTDQADVLGGSFTYQGSHDDGGGCFSVTAPAPPGPRDVLLGSWWMALLFLVVAARAFRARLARQRV
jgi:hypothetical protein